MLYDCRSMADRDRGIAAAIEAVRNGELVVLPTDTVYGIGADAFTPYAVRALLDAKDAPHSPPPVLIGSRHTLDGLVFSLPTAARDLVEAFWPGALTILVQHSASLRWDLGDDSGVVAVRMPLHPVALEVLRETGPMAVASANKFGQQPALTADEARDQLGYSVRAYLEAGPAVDPVPSTIVDLTGDVPVLVREGGIGLAKLREVVPELRESQVA
ncbi:MULTISPECIES: L-threonylcarbamoyladenylate synthase [Micromonospora]|uniref:L-threonylcarbamoyladenylate synthase n=1 Tax=Micromonospora maris TaxID=1003110 RepID=A0A9X0I5S5_9ACTN|nr:MULTISPECIES: L-threonylcarbamoyladenylate synthase [Micromonospora]AEB47000.1 sua5/ycio/yrdc/ywlc family protein [Micromonospora maris AB-18-032]KUJ47279.1 translation factor SUA5 [Micromonospora maris]RUL94077.1 threonylcarbamoyl-AMP synthase [Verrucosispora sp. FIM060022]